MAKKGKMKISKVKRNNHTTNKMKKAGTLRLQRHRHKVQKQKQPAQQQQVEYSSDSESASGEDWADMLDEEEQQYIMGRLAKQPQLLSNVPEENVKEERKAPKRKRSRVPQPAEEDSGAASLSDSDADVEACYERAAADAPAKRLKPLLPIKTKAGLQERSEEVEESESETETQAPPAKKAKPAEESEAESDSGLEAGAEPGGGGGADGEDTVSAVQLLAARRDRLAHEKLRIGALCSSLLECPEKKLKNLHPILYLMEERLKDGAPNLHSVRKLAALSAAEVFRDVLPDYTLRHQDYADVKLKKDTLSLYKYEKELLDFYKRYLQKLEKASAVLRRKKGDSRKPDEAAVSLALVSLQCMCNLLVARPHFNYSTNIAQSVVPYLDCREARARDAVTRACEQVFADDHKGDITLTIVRLINQLVKRRGARLPPAALDCLLALRIRDVDLDAEADIRHKKKQEEKHKKRIVNLSKKEKKRNKKLKEVERELLETAAQESAAARRAALTDVTRVVFHLYFRLLKHAPAAGLLAAALRGLAKFTHVINLEYYCDLVAVLARLLATGSLDARARLACARTALGVLAGAGDALAVDPATFHHHLYNDMLTAHAGDTADAARAALEGVAQVCGRARLVSAGVLAALGKRLATLALQLPPHAALAALLLLHRLAQQSKAVSMLLENEEACGSGRFSPTSASPEHCGAHAASLAELSALARHYHPEVRAAARALPRGALPQHLANLSPMQAFNAYDGSQMAFKPAIPVPKVAPLKQKKLTAEHRWSQPDLQEMCQRIENSVQLVIR